MLLKLGVDISRLRPAIRKRLGLIEHIHFTCFDSEMVVTSSFEGSHMSSSLHYANLAIDVRLPGAPEDFIQKLRAELGRNYDIVLESDHIHIEYDPKP